MKKCVLFFILLFQILSFPLIAQDNPFIILDIKYSPDGTKLAVAGGNPQCDPNDLSKFVIRILDAQTFDTLTTLSGHECDVSDLDWNPTSEFLVSGGLDSGIVWDVKNGFIISTYLPSNNSLTYEGQVWNPTYNEIAEYVHNDPQIYIWDPFTGESLREFTLPTRISSLAWDVTGEKLLVGGFNEAFIVGRETGLVEATFNLNGGSTLAMQQNPHDIFKFAFALVASPELIITDFDSNEVLHSLPIDGVLDVQWRPDGRVLAIQRTNNRITFWDTVTEEIVLEFQSDYIIRAFAWNPKTGWLVVSKPDVPKLLQVIPFDGSDVPTLTTKPSIVPTATYDQTP